MLCTKDKIKMLHEIKDNYKEYEEEYNIDVLQNNFFYLAFEHSSVSALFPEFSNNSKVAQILLEEHQKTDKNKDYTSEESNILEYKIDNTDDLMEHYYASWKLDEYSKLETDIIAMSIYNHIVGSVFNEKYDKQDIQEKLMEEFSKENTIFITSPSDKRLEKIIENIRDGELFLQNTQITLEETNEIAKRSIVQLSNILEQKFSKEQDETISLDSSKILNGLMEKVEKSNVEEFNYALEQA